MKIKDIKIGYDHRSIMKGLHSAYGLDFEAPYCGIEHNGKFTTRMLINEMKQHGFTPDDSIILVLVQGWHNWDKDDFYVVRIYENDFDIASPYCVDHYSRKYDFNDARKRNECHAILLGQKKEDLKSADFFRDRWGYSRKGKDVDYYGRFKSEKDVPHGGFGRYNHEIDKSGYCLDVYHCDLYERAEKYKAEKAQKAYLETDNSGQVDTLERLIDEYKNKLSKAVLNASSSDEMRAISRLMGWGGLPDIMETFETFKQKTKDKSYNSISASNVDYDYVAKKCYAYLG